MAYRILYLNCTTQIGGAEMSLLHLVTHLDRESFYPIVILPDKSGPLVRKLAEYGIETAFVALDRLRKRNPFPYLLTVFRLMKFIRSRKIDLVHSNIRLTSQYSVIAAKLTGVPVVSHVRNIMTRELFYEYLLCLSDTLVANSYGTETSYKNYMRKKQQSVVIHNGIDLNWFMPHKKDSMLRKALGIDENTFLIGVVAELVPDKGHAWFLQAFKQLTEVCPDVCALFVGGTKINETEWYLNDLREQTKSLGLSAKVLFTDFIEDIASVYDTIDVLVLPSKEEPFGRVLVEAMAMEKPVIATKVGGAVEVVSDGETGFLVPFQNTDALVNAVLEIIRNPQLGKRFGKEGRKRVAKLFDINLNVQKTQQLYLDILTSNSREKNG